MFVFIFVCLYVFFFVCVCVCFVCFCFFLNRKQRKKHNNKENNTLPPHSPNPQNKTKQIKTKLLVKDGGVAMSGGISKTTDKAARNGVPFFADIPFIGQLFRSNDNTTNKNQLYIFIAPKVL
jgi:type II secretory pathway component GspD/PulD (secretin)